MKKTLLAALTAAALWPMGGCSHTYAQITTCQYSHRGEELKIRLFAPSENKPISKVEVTLTTPIDMILSQYDLESTSANKQKLVQELEDDLIEKVAEGNHIDEKKISMRTTKDSVIFTASESDPEEIEDYFDSIGGDYDRDRSMRDQVRSMKKASFICE